jgi:hypothetical protein
VAIPVAHVLPCTLLNHLVRGRFKAYSAGTHPKVEVDLFALQRNRVVLKWRIELMMALQFGQLDDVSLRREMRRNALVSSNSPSQEPRPSALRDIDSQG